MWFKAHEESEGPQRAQFVLESLKLGESGDIVLKQIR
jgi:hypothetical protein